MTNTRITQAHKVIVSAGGNVPARFTQAHKIILLSVGSVPAQVLQAHKIMIVRVEPEAPPDLGRRRNFMSFSP